MPRRFGRSEKLPRIFSPRKQVKTQPPGRVRIPGFIIKGRRGPRTPFVGPEELELRAVSEDILPGSILERIVYKAIWQRLGPPNPLIWDPQPAFLGGRMILGGMVADVIIRAFPGAAIIIQVQSFAFHPRGMEITASRTATSVDRMVDVEQKAILESMDDPLTGSPIVVYEIWEDEVLDPARLEDWMDRHLRAQIFNASGQIRSGGTWMPNQAEWDALQMKVAGMDSLLEAIRADIVTITQIGSVGTILPPTLGVTFANLRSDNWIMVSPKEGIGDFTHPQPAIEFARGLASATNPYFVLCFPAQYVIDSGGRTAPLSMASDVYVMSVVPRIPELVEFTSSTATGTFTTVDFNGVSRCGLVGIKISNTRNDATNVTYAVRIRGSCDKIYLVDAKPDNTNTTKRNARGISDENINASGNVFLGEVR